MTTWLANTQWASIPCWRTTPEAKAKFVLGLTATPIRRDGQQPIIFMQCGPVRHTAAKPVGSPHDLEVVPRSLSVPIDLPAGAGIQDVFRHLANDAVRTEAIAFDVGAAVERGRKILVLTERTEHIDAILAALEGVTPAPFVLHGRLSKKQRAALITELDAYLLMHPAFCWPQADSLAKALTIHRSIHCGTGHADFLERHLAAVCRSSASRACQQDERAHYRFYRHGPSDPAENVGQAAARLQGDGLPHNRRLCQ